MKLADMLAEDRLMQHLPIAIGKDKVRVLCFETEDLKTEFDADDNEIAALFSEAMARIKNIKVFRCEHDINTKDICPSPVSSGKGGSCTSTYCTGKTYALLRRPR